MSEATLKLDAIPEGYTLKSDGGTAGSISKVERTAQGGLKVTGRATRSGVFEYLLPDGRVQREYRSPEEISKLDSLATLDGAPITDNHPYEHGGEVNPNNYSILSKGHASAPKWDGKKWVEATLFVQDAALIRKIDAGTRELSCGLLSRDIHTPGVTPEGEPYDVLNTNLRYNHIAIVPRARAGSEARIKLDASGLPALDKKESAPMITIKIDGVDYPLDTEANQRAANLAMTRWATKLDADASTLKGELERVKGELDGTKAKLDAAAKELTEARDPAKLDAAITRRVSLVTTATEVLGAEAASKLDSETAIVAAVIAKVYPGLKLDGKSADYLQGMFDSAIAKSKADSAADPNGHAAVVAVLASGRGTETTQVKQDAALTPQERMRKEAIEAGTKPLAMTK